MDYSNEIVKLIEDGNAKLFEYTSEINKRLDALETAEAKGNRGNIFSGMSEKSDPEVKSWADEFLRKGETKSMAWSTNSGADGGYTVPKQIDQMIDAVAVNQGAMLRLVRVVDSYTQDYHVVTQNSRNANGWVGETDPRPATNTGQFTDTKPNHGELYAFPQITRQLVDDAGFNIENYVVERVGEEFGAAIETSLLTGNGTNKPLGLLSATYAATDDASRTFGQFQYVPTGVSADWAASNKADILLSLVYKVKAAYRQNGSWLMHPQVMQDRLQ